MAARSKRLRRAAIMVHDDASVTDGPLEDDHDGNTGESDSESVGSETASSKSSDDDDRLCVACHDVKESEHEELMRLWEEACARTYICFSCFARRMAGVAEGIAAALNAPAHQ